MSFLFLSQQKYDDAYIYTIDKLLQHLVGLEEHFKDYPCWNDCIPKHIQAIKLYFNEAIDLAPQQNHKKFWIELKEEFLDFVENLKENANQEELNSYAQKVRQIRKKIFGFINQLEQCPVCTLPPVPILPFLALAGVRCITRDEWKWEEKKPKTPSERRELLKKCGRDCFLDPERLAFPICNKRCCVDCDGLRAAYVRARSLVTASKRANKPDLAKYYEGIAEKAKSLAIKYGCEWAK